MSSRESSIPPMKPGHARVEGQGEIIRADGTVQPFTFYSDVPPDQQDQAKRLVDEFNGSKTHE